MALGGDDAQTTQRLDLLMLLRPLSAQAGYFSFFSSSIKRLIGFNGFYEFFHVATQHNVRTPTGHIGGNRDHLGSASLRNDVGFTRMLLGIENLMRQVFLHE